MLKAQLKQELLGLSKEDVDEAWDVLKLRFGQLQQQVASEFVVGDKVEFEGRGGQKLKGEVVKVNKKTLAVSTEQGKWKVSAGLAQKVA